MNGFLNFLETKLTPIAASFGSNKYLRAISSGFVAIMAATIVGSIFTLICWLPIPGWTDWLMASGLFNILSLPSQVTIDVIAVYASFFIAYSLAKEFNVEAGGAGLTGLVCFFLCTGRASYLSPADGTTAVSALSLDYLGSKGLFTAMIVGLIASRLYIFAVKKNWTIKLPDSVPPNVTAAFSSLIPAGFAVVIMLVVAGLMSMTSYGTLSNAVFTIIQSNLMRFMGNNFFSYLFFDIMASLLWFFGLHGGNIVGSITQPIYIPLMLENLAAYQAGSKVMPNIISQAFAGSYMFGGIGSMFGMAILMCLFAKSKQYKMLGRLSLPTTLFFINEPLLFGMPVVLNPMFFIPLVFTSPILGSLTYVVMKMGLVQVPYGLNLPWTTPPLISGFLQGGFSLMIWQVLMILGSMIIWYPFFRMGDKAALKEEEGQE
ncbi:MAG: PTS transporter subunit EIIC [Erysipelotrichaceae bacterium]|nr:PTS transporter subunit EIIC [Erysipelotrichaceae bacterium]